MEGRLIHPARNDKSGVDPDHRIDGHPSVSATQEWHRILDRSYRGWIFMEIRSATSEWDLSVTIEG